VEPVHKLIVSNVLSGSVEVLVQFVNLALCSGASCYEDGWLREEETVLERYDFFGMVFDNLVIDEAVPFLRTL
jgi:hypothetical protein